MTEPVLPTNRIGDSRDAETGSVPTDGPVLRSGVDVVGIERIASALDEFGQSFKDRIFTPTEQAYCDRRPDPAQHYAVRWAAKEAFQKAIASSGPSIPFAAVGITRTDDGPVLSLQSAAQQALADTLTQENASPQHATTSVSLAHDQPAGIAIAHVVIGAEHPASTPNSPGSNTYEGKR